MKNKFEKLDCPKCEGECVVRCPLAPAGLCDVDCLECGGEQYIKCQWCGGKGFIKIQK